MINLPQGFNIGTTESIDLRLVLSLEEMKTMKDSMMPDVYLTVCRDDGALYLYNKNNTFSEQTGKFILIPHQKNEVLTNEEIDILIHQVKNN